MKRIITFFALYLTAQIGFGQILRINELDCDTPSSDDKEFVETGTETICQTILK